MNNNEHNMIYFLIAILFLFVALLVYMNFKIMQHVESINAHVVTISNMYYSLLQGGLK